MPFLKIKSIYRCNNNVMKKTKTLMLRLDVELLEKFHVICSNERTTMSHEIRQFIIKYIND